MSGDLIGLIFMFIFPTELFISFARLTIDHSVEFNDLYHNLKIGVLIKIAS